MVAEPPIAVAEEQAEKRLMEQPLDMPWSKVYCLAV